ncbi:MAG: YjjG family noncanonical pyrimidine nucleotidase, partial [Candidatus Hydrogenedentales bacterium]
AFEQFGLEATGDIVDEYDEINRGLWKKFERGETDQATLKIERFRLLFRKVGVNLDVGHFSDTYLDWLGKGGFLLDGAEELCEYLAGKYRLAIVTNGIKRVQRSRFDNSSIRRYFESIVISEEAGSSKPSAGIFDYACRSLGFHDKSRIIMVGDSLSSDIAGGANYGMDTCWVNLSEAANDTDIAPTYEVRRLKDIMRIL